MIYLFAAFGLTLGAPAPATSVAPISWNAASPSTTEPQDDVNEKLSQANEYLERIPIGYHRQAYALLCQAKAPNAVERLAEIYLKPGYPKEATRNLIAVELGLHGGSSDVVAKLGEWLEDADEARDAWLWRGALAIEVEAVGPEHALDVARTAKKVALRAAAIEALAVHKHESLYELLPEILEAMPKKDGEKIALMGAMATALAELGTKKSQVDTPWKSLALRLIAQLENDKMPRTAKLILARHLASKLDADRVVLEAGAWRELLAQRSMEAKERNKGKKPKANDGDKKVPEYVRPSFFGVEVSGERICYLIDLSDSMAEEVPDAWKPKGPLSGESEAKRRKKGSLPTEADIPWGSVETRLDVAREHLRISLQRLQPDQKFTVIGFGTEADFIDGCEGMVKASSGNVKKVLKALDKIKIGSAQPERPHGTIWGDTNLHSALRLAFAVSKKGAVREDEYVDMETLVHGSDTIFVLSDGNPSVDDFTAEDMDYGDATIVDGSDERKEKKREGTAMKSRYFGPYAQWPILLADTKRMNMLQEAEIHVIGIGNADEQALQMLANLGLGTLTIFGKDK